MLSSSNGQHTTGENAHRQHTTEAVLGVPLALDGRIDEGCHGGREEDAQPDQCALQAARRAERPSARLLPPRLLRRPLLLLLLLLL